MREIAMVMHAVLDVIDAILGLSVSDAGDLSTAQVCSRAVFVYVVLIGYVRFGKKRFLGQATAFDAVLVIIVGSMASRAISGTAPFIATLTATFVLIAAHWVISYLTELSSMLGYLVKGYDTLIIRNGRVNLQALRGAHMSEDDLAEDLRQRGVSSLRQVKEARLERSGKLSVIKK